MIPQPLIAIAEVVGSTVITAVTLLRRGLGRRGCRDQHGMAVAAQQGGLALRPGEGVTVNGGEGSDMIAASLSQLMIGAGAGLAISSGMDRPPDTLSRPKAGLGVSPQP